MQTQASNRPGAAVIQKVMVVSNSGKMRSQEPQVSVEKVNESERCASTLIKDAVPRGLVIGPVPMNLYMHYGFDRWMQQKHPYNLFARYAVDAVVRCSFELQAKWKLVASEKRLEECGLNLKLQKSAIVHFKNGHRPETLAHKQLTFLGDTFRPRGAKNRYGKLFDSFPRAVSREATKEMLRTIKSWKLSRQPRPASEILQPVTPDNTRMDELTTMDSSTSQFCSESLIASKRLWCSGFVVNLRSSGGTQAAASNGYGEWQKGSPHCSSICAYLAELAVGLWGPYDGRLSHTVLKESGGDPPPAY